MDRATIVLCFWNCEGVVPAFPRKRLVFFYCPGMVWRVLFRRRGIVGSCFGRCTGQAWELFGGCCQFV